MDFLPCLIPGSLSSRINATLAAVQNESNNGYNYLWRVLELTVPGFDPVISIQTLQWLDCNDIFQFSKLYLLYFCLQAMMHYHFTNCMRSGIFFCAIQYSNYADTVTLPSSHMSTISRRTTTWGSYPPISNCMALLRVSTSMHKPAYKT
jgi:hypothetical protein